MTCDRRGFVLGLGALLGPAAAMAGPPAKAPAPGVRPRPKTTHFTSRTAPDAVSRALLASPLASPWHGAPKGADIAPYVARNFARIIAQNCAAQSPRQLSRFFATASQTDLMRLGQAYADSLATSGEPPLALDVLAARLEPGQLASLCPVFGFAPMAESVNRVAPSHYSHFATLAPKVPAPVAFSRGLESLGGEGVGGASAMRPGNQLDMRIEQIYQSFRNAPYPGAMSVRAALYSTANAVSKPLSMAASGGYFAGSMLVWGMERFTPGFWNLVVDGLGGFLYDLERNIYDPGPVDPILSPEEQLGLLQRAGYLERMRLPSEHTRFPDLYEHYCYCGGSFGETNNWTAANASLPPINPCIVNASCDTGTVIEQ